MVSYLLMIGFEVLEYYPFLLFNFAVAFKVAFAVEKRILLLI
jgi:hypothetical protein